MKIEDIKPDDVIVRTEDKILFKVVEVTPDRQIMQSANGKMNEVFCIFQEPQPMVSCSMDDYEPATEEQREYMESKLAAFNGTNPEVESKRITALASIMGDLKQENIELAERVKQLTEDNNRMAKRIDSSRTMSDLTEALDKLDELERDKNFFKKEYDHGQKLYESLFNQHDIQSKELKVVREERDEAKEQYNDLQQKHEELRQQYDAAKDELQKPSDKLRKAYDDYRALRDLNDTANSRLARFENSELVKIGMPCLEDEKVKVGYCCSVCEHCMKEHLTLDEDYYLCAYKYDKKQEKEEELENFRRKRNRHLNEK